MNSMTKWMLVAALVAANGVALAVPQAYHLEGVVGEPGCRTHLHCVPVVKPNPKASPAHAPKSPPPPPPHKGTNSSNQTNNSNHGANTGPGSNSSQGNNQGSNPNPGTFACGEVVSGYTVSCNNTTPPTNTRVSAPEIDASGAVSGAMLVVGSLAIMHGRRRRLEQKARV
ncbi:MAG TPA: hypothetical protein VI653_22670 [Steroidobacteraceae bacterium]